MNKSVTTYNLHLYCEPLYDTSTTILNDSIYLEGGQNQGILTYEGEKNQLPLIPKVFLPPGVNFITMFGANAEQLLRIKCFDVFMATAFGKNAPKYGAW